MKNKRESKNDKITRLERENQLLAESNMALKRSNDTLSQKLRHYSRHVARVNAELHALSNALNDGSRGSVTLIGAGGGGSGRAGAGMWTGSGPL